MPHESTWVLVGVLAAVAVLLAVRMLPRFRRDQHSGLRPSELAARLEQARVEVEAARVAAEEAAADLRTRAEAEITALRSRAEDDVAERRALLDQAVSAARAAQDAAEEEIRSLRSDLREQRLDLERRERRATEREEHAAESSREVDRKIRLLADEETRIQQQRAELADVAAERQHILEQTAELSAAEAKAELVSSMEHAAKREAALRIRDIEARARADGEQTARAIVTGAIQRVASEQTAEAVVSVVHLPSDDLKGRIIGREGRNIRSFESVTGVNVIIDDTPDTVLLSCFDPIRREVARVALHALVADGRIHPQRIEEVYERSRAEVAAMCRRAGEDAALEVGVADIHPELIQVLGQLRYRTSYGQNVLRHLVESAHLAGLMASEIGVDRDIVKRAAFLHDIGKALTHEVEGSHAMVGADLARRYGESEDVVHAIEAHHNEVEPRTVEAVLTQAADAISGSRPGARRESVEAYVRRLERLEEIAHEHDGVDKVFAMQAGREIRVMVSPDVVDDLNAQILARDIAKQFEEELTYPGQIRVVVVRESRAIEVAR